MRIVYDFTTSAESNFRKIQDALRRAASVMEETAFELAAEGYDQQANELHREVSRARDVLDGIKWNE